MIIIKQCHGYYPINHQYSSNSNSNNHSQWLALNQCFQVITRDLREIQVCFVVFTQKIHVCFKVTNNNIVSRIFILSQS